MAIGDDIQHRYRMPAVRTPFPSHPLVTGPSSPGRLYARRPSDHRRIRFRCLPYRTKDRNRPRDLMTYTSFHRSVARPNSTKPNGGLNQRLCCVDLFPTALQRLRRYVMESGFPPLNIITIPKWHHTTLYSGGNLVKESSEHIPLYVWSCYHPTRSPHSPPHSPGVFPFPGSTDGCGV